MDLRRKGANALEFMDEVPDSADLRPDPAEALVAGASADIVRKAVGTLPETLRVPVVLYYFEEFGVSEIASLLDVPVGTVKFRLHEARRRLAIGVLQTEFKDRASYKVEDERRGRQVR